MNWIGLQKLLYKAAAQIYPRRCPFCGELLGSDAVEAVLCRDCLTKVKRLLHNPPRLAETEHSFSALDGAASVYYYEEEIRYAILCCKLHGYPWFARELADIVAIRLFGALPASRLGGMPRYDPPGGLRPYDCIVPVPPRLGSVSWPRLPDLMADRLARILQLPVCRDLYPVRMMQPQKQLSLSERLKNQKDGYALRSTNHVLGRRVLLVDDIITSGATVSACAMALYQGGAASVFAVSLAVDEVRKSKSFPRHNQPPRSP